MSNVMAVAVPDNDTAYSDASDPPWSHIKVAAWQGKSSVVSCRNVQPLKILNPRNLSESSQVYLSSYGGGMVAGDDIRLKIECDRDSKLFLGTQADTKIYKSVNGQTARQYIHGRIAENATAVVLPDALIPFANSRFKQAQEWHLAKSANLLVADWIHSGRSGHGECFDFDTLESEVTIAVDGKKRIIERLKLEPGKTNLRAIGAFGKYRSMLNIYIVGATLRNSFQELEFLQAKLSEKSGIWVATNRVQDDVLIVRIMSIRKEAISDYVKLISRALASNDALGFDPYKRKY